MSQLLNEIRALATAKLGRSEPGERYADWVKRYVLFHGTRHPRDMGRAEVGAFLRQRRNQRGRLP